MVEVVGKLHRHSLVAYDDTRETMTGERQRPGSGTYATHDGNDGDDGNTTPSRRRGADLAAPVPTTVTVMAAANRVPDTPDHGPPTPATAGNVNAPTTELAVDPIPSPAQPLRRVKSNTALNITGRSV
jgi:hypothetical protein